MKIIVQIPCKNESDNLKTTIEDIPKRIEGIGDIEILVIDDGSSDDTTKKAIELGVDHVLRFETNRGLARTFAAGMSFSKSLGADIIINTDGDNQYRGEYISLLAKALIDKKAGIVIGARDISSIKHFSWIKKMLQYFGSFIVSLIAGYRIPDAPSGFRAFSSAAAARITILSKYTYTLESLIQAKSKGISVEFIDIKTNPATRESRLMKSSLHYIVKSFRSLIVIIILYEPVWAGLIFGISSLLMLLLGFVLSNNIIIISSIIAAIFNAFFTLLLKVLITHRINTEEAIRFIARYVDPVECASKLGAGSYYCRGVKAYSFIND